MAECHFLLLLSTGLGTLRTVLGTGLVAVGHTLGVQSTTDDVVTHTGKVLNTAATDQYYAVLLQVVANRNQARSKYGAKRPKAGAAKK